MGERRVLRLLGYWAGAPLGRNWPQPERLVDDGWDAAERDAVARYLRHGLLVRTLEHRNACLLCGVLLPAEELSDGDYLWPLSLEHYVSAHSVRLPSEFLRHAGYAADARMGWEVSADWWRQQKA